MAAFDSPMMGPAIAPQVGAVPSNFGPRMAAAFAGQPPPAVPGDRPINAIDDDLQLLKLFRDCHKQAFDNRWVYERNWWRNLLYILGRQWIYYNVQRGAWADKRMQQYIPRPVTNKMSETVDAMRSVFQAVELVAKARPNGDDWESMTAAETADKSEPSIRAEHDMTMRMFEADFWNIAVGNVFLHPWFDKRAEHGMILVKFEKCAACGTVSAPDLIVKSGQRCPACGMSAFEPAIGQDGQPIGKEYPVGRGTTDVCSPFEIGLPPGVGVFAEVPWLIRARWRTKEWYEKNHNEIVKDLTFSQNANDRSLQMIRSLASQSDIQGTNLGTQGGESNGQEGLTEFELWYKPTPQFPAGLLLRVAGESGKEKVLRFEDENLPGPLPMTTQKGQPIFPWIHMGYTRFGGRIWHRSPLDTAVQKQDQINQLDSLILLGVQRMSNPVWLEPKGAEVKKFTGQPGLVVRYNPMVAGGNAKPERIEGSNIPPSLLKLRDQYASEFEGLVGTQDVLKGAKPAGIEAFSALQLLVERSQSRFGPVLAARGEAYRQWYELALEIERQFGPNERIWASMGANGRWAFQTFKNADLQGSVKIIMEDGSQAPKTNLGKRAAIQQLSSLQLLTPDDPDQKFAIYQAFGTTELLPGLNSAVQNALAEQAEFEEWASSPLSRPMPQPMAPPQTQLPGFGGMAAPRRAYFDDTAEGEPPTAMPNAAPAGIPFPQAALPAQPAAPPQMGAPTAQPANPAQPGLPGAPMQPMMPQPIVPSPMQRKAWQDDIVHLAQHRRWGNADTARQIFKKRPDLEQVFTLHLMEHSQAMMMAAGAAAGPPQPGVPGGEGAGRAMQNSNQESGKPGVNQTPPA
jgi:hypothetical protein